MARNFQSNSTKKAIPALAKRLELHSMENVEPITIISLLDEDENKSKKRKSDEGSKREETNTILQENNNIIAVTSSSEDEEDDKQLNKNDVTKTKRRKES